MSAIEASSHGLAQYRLDGLEVAAAAFTNLTRDHLDYHGDMDGYRAAKERLFTALLAPGGTAVLNADSPEFARLAALVPRARRHGHRRTAAPRRPICASPRGGRAATDSFSASRSTVRGTRSSCRWSAISRR